MREITLAQQIEKQVKRMRQVERVRMDIYHLSLDINDNMHTMLDREWNEAVKTIRDLTAL